MTILHSYRPKIVQTPNQTWQFGRVNCTDPKSYRHQIGLGNLGGGGKSYRPQIVQTPNWTWRFGVCTIYPPLPKSPSLIWCLYNLGSVQFIVIFQHIFLTPTSCFASQRPFLRKTKKIDSNC